MTHKPSISRRLMDYLKNQQGTICRKLFFLPMSQNFKPKVPSDAKDLISIIYFSAPQHLRGKQRFCKPREGELAGDNSPPLAVIK